MLHTRNNTCNELVIFPGITLYHGNNSIIACANPKKIIPEIPLPCTGPELNSSKCGKESKVAFDNCQNCTVNVNIQYAGPSTN